MKTLPTHNDLPLVPFEFLPTSENIETTWDNFELTHRYHDELLENLSTYISKETLSNLEGTYNITNIQLIPIEPLALHFYVLLPTGNIEHIEDTLNTIFP